MRRFLGVAVLSIFLCGCPQLVPIIQGAINAAHWVGSIIEVADRSQRTWFDLNPDASKQAEVEQAVLRARKALAAFNGVAVAAKSADEKGLASSKLELIEAYKALETLLLSINVRVQPGMKAMEPPRIPEASRVQSALLE